MKKYSKAEIAIEVQKKIFELYATPDVIIRDFGMDIHFKVRLASPKRLTGIEISLQSQKIAQNISVNLSKITLPLILKNLSTEIVKKSSKEGIDLADYEDYFTALAKKIIQKLILQRYSTYRRTKKQSEP